MPDLWELPHRGGRQDTADSGDGHSGRRSLRLWARDSQAVLPPPTALAPSSLQPALPALLSASSSSSPLATDPQNPLLLLWPWCKGEGGASFSTVFLGWEGRKRNGSCTRMLKLDLE